MATSTTRSLRSNLSSSATTRTRKTRVAGDTTQRALTKLLDRASDTLASTRATARMRSPEGLPRLLMIIDDFMMRVALRDLAEQTSLVVDSSPNPEAALERFLEGNHVLVATDSISMIRALRAMPPRLQPYICYVVDTVPDDGASGLAAGADDCICTQSTPELVRSRLSVALRVVLLETALAAARADHESVASLDLLTRAGTRRFFEEQFAREIRKAIKQRLPLTIAICDIDHFKRINDTHGHAAGDQILREFSRRILNVMRDKQDWLARIGGEEFAIVFAATSLDDARGLARRIRLVICSEPFRVGDTELHVSASFGLAGLRRIQGKDERIAEHLRVAADKALYKSKESGRNRVTVALLEG